ncbi:MAG TPA: hypothetical protein VNA26_07160, partial [Chitinophagaceae bacterium]|nr:hypothetical protein [Chitinophagaceae bacterium]
TANYKLLNVNNSLILNGRINLQPGMNSFSLPFQNLPAGLYYLIITKNNQPKPISFKIVKQ